MNKDKPTLKDFAGATFKIPYYQRGYRWNENNIIVLLDDLKNFINEETEGKKSNYFMQPLAIYEEDDKNLLYKVVDGQQRLTTFYLINKYLHNDNEFIDKSWYSLEYEYKISENNNGDNNKQDIESILGSVKDIKSKEDIKKESENINQYYMKAAYFAIEQWFLENYDNEDKRENAKRKFKCLFDRKNKDEDEYNFAIRFLWYPVSKGQENDVFQNINSGKIQLTNSDLIKAVLLCSSSVLDNKEQIAIQFENMERQFEDDRFWYMFNNRDVREDKGQSRLDALLNLSTNISKSDYNVDSKKSFYEVMKYDKEKLNLFWKTVRANFQILLEFYKNPEYYHYIGFLRYADNSFEFGNWIELYKQKRKTEFLSSMKDSIKKYFKERSYYFKNIIKNQEDWADLKNVNYEDNNQKELRKLFVFHNVQTILHRYRILKESKQNSLQFPYESFPFDLLYNETWNIEHIDSRKTQDLETHEEKLIWLKDIVDEFDNIDNYKEINVEEIANNDESFKEFKKVFNDFVGIGEEEAEDNSLGNLVLLDEHTNKFFHNSFFPKKRRVVLRASGIENGEQGVDIKYIPVCTRDVYTKAYSRECKKAFICWADTDKDAYLEDIIAKFKELD